MALKAILDSLDGLSDELKKLYAQKDGKFHLDVEGLIPASKLDEFRTNNIALLKEKDALTEKLKGFDGIDVAKLKELQATEQKVKEGQLIAAGKFDEVFASKLDPIKKEFQTQLDATKKENQALHSRLETLMIDDQLTKLATTKGLRPTAIDDMIARGQRVFKLKDGKPVALGQDGAQILTKSGDPVTMQTWIDSLATDAPHLFQSSSGGGANGNNGNLPPGTKTMKRADFDALDSQSKMTFTVKDGGKVLD